MFENYFSEIVEQIKDPRLQLVFLCELLLSIILGFAIGFERKIRNKEASVKTHTIVCFGACLMMIISRFGFGDSDHDTSRIASQIVTGVGFLGAGMIVFRKNSGIHGLTTAAGVWATAGIGMACGSNLWYLAIGATILIIAAQVVLHIDKPFFQKKKFNTFNVVFIQDNDANLQIKELFNAEKFQNFTMEKHDGKIIINATIISEKTYSTVELTEIMNNNDFIISIERLQED